MRVSILAAAASLFQGQTLAKIIVAVFMVLSLSILAEKVSTRFAGLLSGFPLGAAIALFFIGFDVSPEFAAQSAVYTILGLMGTLCFVLGYYGASRLLTRPSGPLATVFSGAGGVLFYFLAAMLMQRAQIRLLGAVFVSLVGILFSIFLFRRLKNVKIRAPIQVSWWLLTLRALLAALLIILVTASAEVLGHRWAGVLSAFPTTLLPFLAIIHLTYQREHIWTILKNVPKGLGAIIIYAVIVALTYPQHGIWWGTLEGYLGACAYLFLLHLPASRKLGVSLFKSDFN
jgi:hypothetical protein